MIKKVVYFVMFLICAFATFSAIAGIFYLIWIGSTLLVSGDTFLRILMAYITVILKIGGCAVIGLFTLVLAAYFFEEMKKHEH